MFAIILYYFISVGGTAFVRRRRNNMQKQKHGDTVYLWWGAAFGQELDVMDAGTKHPAIQPRSRENPRDRTWIACHLSRLACKTRHDDPRRWKRKRYVTHSLDLVFRRARCSHRLAGHDWTATDKMPHHRFAQAELPAHRKCLKHCYARQQSTACK